MNSSRMDENSSLKVKKQYLYLLAGVIILCLIGMAGYLIAPLFQPKITVMNQSKNFTISYKQNALLEKTLNDWGFWKQNGLRINASIETYTAKRIVVTLTDIPQTTYRLTMHKTTTLTSASIFIKDNVYEIRIYLSPELKKLGLPKNIKTKDQYYTGYATWDIMTAIYTSTHLSKSATDREQKVADFILNNITKKQNYPFLIKGK